MKAMDTVPQTKQQWVGFLVYFVLEFLLGKTRLNSLMEAIWIVVRFILFKILGRK